MMPWWFYVAIGLVGVLVGITIAYVALKVFEAVYSNE